MTKAHPCMPTPESVPGTVAHPPEYRVEQDTMGEVRVPVGAMYGAQTQRAVENFPISGTTLSRHHIAALAQIKRAAAVANHELGVFDEKVSAAIAGAADAVVAGYWDDHFPVDVFQTGSGTSSNMNMNEVVARLASERLGSAVHPNDHVNASQSSNDVFPASIHIAATQRDPRVAAPRPRPPGRLAGAQGRGVRRRRQVRAHAPHGRHPRHPRAGVRGLRRARSELGLERVQGALPRLAELPLGGTAVGTGINTPAGFPAAGHRARRASTRAFRSPRPRTTSRPRAPWTPSSRRPARSARSRSRS